LTDDQLAPLGWLPYTETNTTYDPLTQMLGVPTITITDTAVTAVYSPSYLPVAECILNRCNAMDAYCDAIFENGFWLNGNLFDCDLLARTNISGGVLAAIASSMNLPSGFCWRSKNNYNVPITGTELVELGMAIMDIIHLCSRIVVS